MSENQPAMSLTGERTLLAPDWIGEMTSTMPALHVVQRAGRRLAEIGGEQDQGDADQQREHCASPANLFVMHELRVSKFAPNAPSVLALWEPSTGDDGCVNSCWNGGSLRTPRANVLTRPRRTSAETPPGARASASRDADAPLCPVAANRLRPA